MPSYADFYRQSLEQRDAVWAEQAKLIDWQRQPDKVCDYSNPPFAAWFAGGLTNLCHNAVDRHLATRPDQAALIAVSTETGLETVYSFRDLHAEVQRMAASLLGLGVVQGDRVLIYMPMVAEAAFAMLACARIGAIHCVVFGGFASGSLASRIEDASPRVVVSADAGSRGGKVVDTNRCSTRPSVFPATSQRRCCWSTGAWRRWPCKPDAITAGAICVRGTWARPCPAPGWMRCTRVTRCIPAAPPASPRVCSATLAGTAWHWPPA